MPNVKGMSTAEAVHSTMGMRNETCSLLAKCSKNKVIQTAQGFPRRIQKSFRLYMVSFCQPFLTFIRNN